MSHSARSLVISMDLFTFHSFISKNNCFWLDWHGEMEDEVEKMRCGAEKLRPTWMRPNFKEPDNTGDHGADCWRNISKVSLCADSSHHHGTCVCFTNHLCAGLTTNPRFGTRIYFRTGFCLPAWWKPPVPERTASSSDRPEPALPPGWKTLCPPRSIHNTPPRELTRSSRKTPASRPENAPVSPGKQRAFPPAEAQLAPLSASPWWLCRPSLKSEAGKEKNFKAKYFYNFAA